MAQKTTRLSFLLLLLSALALAAPASKSTRWIFDVSQGAGKVSFRAIGRPSMLKILGTGDRPDGTLEVKGDAVSGELTFKLESLDTGINKRNGHMKENYLETAKYPQALLTITELKLPKPMTDGLSLENLPFKGKLALHGVEKPVEGKAKVQRTQDKLAVDADFSIKLEDYSIKTPSFAGISITENVEVKTEITAPYYKRQ